MNEIPLQYQEAVDTYEPIEFEGITLFPIRVREYRLFNNARPAIDFLQQSLPVRYLSMPLLSAFYAMDTENLKEGNPSDGLFYRALLFLALAMRLGEGENLEERIGQFQIVADAKDQSVLKGVEFQQNGEVQRITPVQFQRLRPILAAQNGITLVSTDANPELVEAERDLAEMNGPELDYNFQTLLSTLSVLSGTRERDLYDWPILQMTRYRDAYSRVLQFLICGIASASGAKFKGGNPVPSPFFNRLERDSDSLIDMGTFTGGKQVSVSETAPPIPAGPTQS